MSNLHIVKSLRSIGLVAAVTVLVAPFDAPAQSAAPAPRMAQAAKPKSQPQPAAAQAAATPAPATAPAPAPAKANEEIIGRVGDANISADDLRSYVAALGAREQAALAKDPAALSQAVRLLLANRLVLQELQAKKWDQQPAITAQLARAREAALVELYLQSVSTPPASFPSDDDLQKVYDAYRASFLVPRQFQLAQIFIAAPKEGDKAAEDKARQQLDDVQRKLKAPGADFTAVAGGDGNAAKDGGDLGWVPETQLRPEIRSQVMGLAKNTVSEPIKLDDGWHIVKLIDTRASYTRTLPEVRDQLVQQIRAERSQMMRRAYLAELLKQHPPVLNELALSSLLDAPKK
ncbi:peptidyl-prolyl cis-trans isomerase [Bradyrhizobium genosp. L]|uniref:peptidylprolyl isomerase n=1 Tax=Bradyrhizobium genosp. L TaxID=83637 RepID=UPI0018A2AFCC|nr:peptidyl-prolyl cis-trans isomerase [Bradyrhizobium genosp. L]QPF84586.1 peptidyl-prolyl cis-trans isomerase [Bradyrhizobium genosp. L]